MNKIIYFVADTVIAYMFAILYAIPIFNVYMLRSAMNDYLELKQMRCKKWNKNQKKK